MADAWFGSVKVSESIKLLRRVPIDDEGGNYKYEIDREQGNNPNAHEFLGAVKTHKAWFPKKEIDAKMNEACIIRRQWY